MAVLGMYEAAVNMREHAATSDLKYANLKEKLEMKINENNFLSQQVERQLQLNSGEDNQNIQMKGQGTDDDESGTEGTIGSFVNERKRQKKSTASGGSFMGERMKNKYKFQEFLLGKKAERKQRQHPSAHVFQKFNKKQKIKSIMPKSTLMKQIAQTYTDL